MSDYGIALRCQGPILQPCWVHSPEGEEDGALEREMLRTHLRSTHPSLASPPKLGEQSGAGIRNGQQGLAEAGGQLRQG